MLRRHLAACDVLVPAQQLKLGGRGDVQDLDATPCLARQLQDSAGGEDRAFTVAPDRQTGRVAFHPLSHAGLPPSHSPILAGYAAAAAAQPLRPPIALTPAQAPRRSPQ